jgi:hypothetical protein
LKILFTGLLLAAVSAFGQISIGIQIGPPPPPHVLRVQPARPGPEFLWVDGYWFPVGNHYKWHAGYWTRPAYPAARWVAPHYEGGRYFGGFWDGNAGRRDHDHHSDRNRYRDDGEHDRGRGHGHDRH